MTSHLDLTDRDQADHPLYGPLAVANFWAQLQTFPAGAVAATLGIPSVPPPAGAFARILEETPPQGRTGLIIDIGMSSGVGPASVLGLLGNAVARDSGSTVAMALSFHTGMAGTALTAAYGVLVRGVAMFGGLALTALHNFFVTSPVQISATITTAYGLTVSSLAAAVAHRPLYDVTTPTSGNHSMLAATLQLFKATPDFGAGVGVLGIANAVTNPSTNPTGGGVLYASGGALYWRGSGGTVTLIAAA